MNLRKSSLIAALAFGAIALPALAGTFNYGTPLYRGTEIDGTPWEWDGTNWTEAEAKRKGADLACQYKGFPNASEYSVRKGQQKGTWRFHTNGSLEWCDFCQWYITDLTCYKKDRE